MSSAESSSQLLKRKRSPQRPRTWKEIKPSEKKLLKWKTGTEATKRQTWSQEALSKTYGNLSWAVRRCTPTQCLRACSEHLVAVPQYRASQPTCLHICISRPLLFICVSSKTAFPLTNYSVSALEDQASKTFTMTASNYQPWPTPWNRYKTIFHHNPSDETFHQDAL